MDEHSCVSIYWLVLFVGGSAVFYRFSGKITRDILQDAKEEINKNKRILAKNGIDRMSEIDNLLHRRLEPVERGVIYCGVVALLILITQVGLIFFDSETLTLSKNILAIFSALIVALFINSIYVFRHSNKKAKDIYMLARVDITLNKLKIGLTRKKLRKLMKLIKEQDAYSTGPSGAK